MLALTLETFLLQVFREFILKDLKIKRYILQLALKWLKSIMEVSTEREKGIK